MFASFAFSEPPLLLQGIWQGKDRLVRFSSDSNAESEPISVVLRLFYGWYSDRAAESPAFSQLLARERNDASAKNAEDVSVSFRTIFENEQKDAGIYELSIFYPVSSSKTKIKMESTVVPIAVVDGKIYLDFLLNAPAQNADFVRVDGENSNSHDGFWRAASNADGITISPPRISGEVRSFFVSGNDVYSLRYWKSEMEYADAQATFSDGNRVFEVAKFLKIGEEVYQCTTGRSTKIRNIEKSTSLPSSAFDSQSAICVLGEPYLVRVDGKSSEQDLLASVSENNVRRHPVPKPVFPPFPIDFHWKEISELEKYNPATYSRRNIDLGK